MDFTEIYPQSNSLVSFSPGAHFILTAFQDRLVVRQADTFQITRSWLLDASPSPTQALFTPAKPKAHTTTSDISITHAAWSCDSEYLLAANAKKGVVHVFKLRDEDWTARIDSGAEGLVRAEWAPDGRTILCFSEWGVRMILLRCTRARLSIVSSFVSQSGLFLPALQHIFNIQFIQTEVALFSQCSKSIEFDCNHPSLCFSI